MSDVYDHASLKAETAADIERRVERMNRALAEHADEIVSRTSGSGLCTVEFNLRGDLVEVRFLEANVARTHDRATLAAEVLGTIEAAQERVAARLLELAEAMS